jgi:hypothetical protein
LRLCANKITKINIAGSVTDWKGKFIVDKEVIVIQIIAPKKNAIELAIKYIFVFLELSNL